MGQKRSYKNHQKELPEEAVGLVLEQGYSVPEAAKSLGIAANILYRWKQSIEDLNQGLVMTKDERDEFKRLRKENKELMMEMIYLKRPACNGQVIL